MSGGSVRSGAAPPMDNHVSRAVVLGDAVVLVDDATNCYVHVARRSTTVGLLVGDRLPGNGIAPDNTILAAFRIEPRRQYAARRAVRKALQLFGRAPDDGNTAKDDILYRALFGKSDTAEADLGEDAYMSMLRSREVTEDRSNEADPVRLYGTVLLYGQVVQLRHLASGKFLSVNSRRKALVQSQYMLAELREDGEGCWFAVMPALRTRKEGQEVREGDAVLLVNDKTGRLLHVGVCGNASGLHSAPDSPSHPYDLHLASSRLSSCRASLDQLAGSESVAAPLPQDVSLTPFAEVNLAPLGSRLQLIPYRAHVNFESSAVLGGTSVFLQDHEAVLLSDTGSVVAGKVSVGRKSNSTIAAWLWQLERAALWRAGDPVGSDCRVRLRHCATNLYLGLAAGVSSSDRKGVVETTESQQQQQQQQLVGTVSSEDAREDSIFKIVFGDDVLVNDTFVRLLHERSGHFLRVVEADTDARIQRAVSPMMESARDHDSLLLSDDAFQYVSSFEESDAAEHRHVALTSAVQREDGIRIVLFPTPSLDSVLEISASLLELRVLVRTLRLAYGLCSRLCTSPPSSVPESGESKLKGASDAVRRLLLEHTQFLERKRQHASFSFYQSLYGDRHIVSICLEIAQIPRLDVLQGEASEMAEHDKTVVALVRSAFALLSVVIEGHAHNSLHLGRSFSFLLELLRHDFGASDVLIVMFRANDRLLQFITERHVRFFIEHMVTRGRKARFLRFLSSLCVQDGISVPQNQDLIARELLCAHSETLISLKESGDDVFAHIPGSSVGGFVSLVVLQASPREYEYLLAQLELMRSLCMGANQTSIAMVASCFSFSLLSKIVADGAQYRPGLRAAVLDLLMGAFVNTGDVAGVSLEAIVDYAEIAEWRPQLMLWPGIELLIPSGVPNEYFVSGDSAEKFNEMILAETQKLTLDWNDSELASLALSAVRAHVTLMKLGFVSSDMAIKYLSVCLSIADLSTDVHVAPEGAVMPELVSEVKRATMEKFKYMFQVFTLVKSKGLLSTFVSIVDDEQLLPPPGENSPSLREIDFARVKAIADRFPNMSVKKDYPERWVPMVLRLATRCPTSLAIAAFDMLFSAFSQNLTLVRQTAHTQVLLSSESLLNVQRARNALVSIQYLLPKSLDSALSKELCDHLSVLASIATSNGKPASSMQTMLSRLGVGEVALRILRRPQSLAHWDTIAVAVFQLLAVYCNKHRSNQTLLWRDSELFFSFVDSSRPYVADFLKCLVAGNRALCLRVRESDFEAVAELLDAELGTWQYLDFLRACVVADGRSLPRNQQIVSKMLACRPQHLFLCITDDEMRAREELCARDDTQSAARLRYHVSLLYLLSDCCRDHNPAAQGEVRTLLPLAQLSSQLCAGTLPLSVQMAQLACVQHVHMYRSELPLSHRSFHELLDYLVSRSLTIGQHVPYDPISPVEQVNTLRTDSSMTTDEEIPLLHRPTSDISVQSPSSISTIPIDDADFRRRLPSVTSESDFASREMLAFVSKHALPILTLAVERLLTNEMDVVRPLVERVFPLVAQLRESVDMRGERMPGMQVAANALLVAVQKRGLTPAAMRPYTARALRATTMKSAATVQGGSKSSSGGGHATGEEILQHNLTGFCRYMYQHHLNDDLPLLLRFLNQAGYEGSVASLIRTMKRAARKNSYSPSFLVSGLTVLRRLITEPSEAHDRTFWQNFYSENGGPQLVVLLLGNTQAEVTHEALSFGIELLEGGNRLAQTHLYEYLKRQMAAERFCTAIRGLFRHSLAEIRDMKRSVKQRWCGGREDDDRD